MRLWVSGGGTAGHVYPAITVLEAATGDVDVRWLGRAASLEEALVTRLGIRFAAVPAAPLVGVAPWRLPVSLARLAEGTLHCLRLLGTDRPDVVLVTGGYVGVPVALAARARRVPLAVFLPDVRPGRAVALLARLADRIAATTEAARAYLPDGKVVVTGYPVRTAVRATERGAARARLDLSAARPVVLVFGGSQGARRLNDAVAGAAEALLARADLVHIAGPRGIDAASSARDGLPEPLRKRYHLHAYLHDQDMADALAAADLVVSRAGAAVLGEYPARALPAVLVPLPIAGGHQAHNARVLAGAGAAVLVDDGDLTAARLADVVLSLLDRPADLERMSAAARALDHPDAARRVWAMLADLATDAPGARGTGAAGGHR